jgi:hypothetical protein
MKRIDRRILFLLVFVGVMIPLLIPMGFRMETTENVRMVYDLVEQTAQGYGPKKIIVSFDYDPSTKPSCIPWRAPLSATPCATSCKSFAWPCGHGRADVR